GMRSSSSARAMLRLIAAPTSAASTDCQDFILNKMLKFATGPLTYSVRSEFFAFVSGLRDATSRTVLQTISTQITIVSRCLFPRYAQRLDASSAEAPSQLGDPIPCDHVPSRGS